jgi:hypothetical protein
VLYTPTVSATPRIIDKELHQLGERLAAIRADGLKDFRQRSDPHGSSPFTELLIVDEADRLKVPRSSSSATITTAAASAWSSSACRLWRRPGWSRQRITWIACSRLLQSLPYSGPSSSGHSGLSSMNSKESGRPACLISS